MLAESVTNPAIPQLMTLTYAEVPETPDICVENYQKFMKRFRYNYGECRFFHCIEAGSKNNRLHHHMVMWSEEFNKQPIMEGYRGLADAWKLGRTNTSPVRGPAGLAYVAKYASKSILRATWSRNPVLGASYFKGLKERILARHQERPYTCISQVPDFSNALVLGKFHKIYFSENFKRDLLADLGVCTTKPDPIAVAIKGVPNGPIDRRRIPAYIGGQQLEEH